MLDREELGYISKSNGRRTGKGSSRTRKSGK